MTSMTWTTVMGGALLTLLFAAAPPAHAQSAANLSPWALEVGVGFDNGIAGHINSSGIGDINSQAVVITSNTYEEVYGTGLNLRFGGGYFLNDDTEMTGIDRAHVAPSPGARRRAGRGRSGDAACRRPSTQ